MIFNFLNLVIDQESKILNIILTKAYFNFKIDDPYKSEYFELTFWHKKTNNNDKKHSIYTITRTNQFNS